jgi:predicted alpha/beta-fold hydrolase
MPVLRTSSFHPSTLFRNGHLQTILPNFFRRIDQVPFERERMDTPDGDFLDLDWLCGGNNRLVILSHGLEGDSRTKYMSGMAWMMLQNDWDVLSWNYRGCSGEPNRLPRFYHSGDTADLDLVVRHALEREDYDRIALVSFSLGGNMTLKYLGEKVEKIDPRIFRAVVFSAPCDLEACAFHLYEGFNKVYLKRFLRSLKDKIRKKNVLMPEYISVARLEALKDFHEFDDVYTAPLHGFKNAKEYYARCSSKQFIKDIRIPVLIVNAKNDPFLPDECYPVQEAENSSFVFLEMPESGGHVGFMEGKPNEAYWAEGRAVEFLEGDL